MKKILLFIFIFISSHTNAQQLPNFSQLNANMYLYNPALTGTKSVIDFRMLYRNQWVGFENAPKTQGLSLHSRLFKGKMGFGAFMIKDETGPTERTNYSLTYAYHIRFPDVELSFGASGNLINYRLNTNKMTLYNSVDVSIDNNLSAKVWSPNANVGMYLYNDRFHFGVSVLNLIEHNVEFYESDTLKNSSVRFEPHSYLSIGYNFSNNPDYVWEHTLLLSYITSTPINTDYNFRFHYKEKVFAGLGVRIGESVNLQTGIVIKDAFQVSYSYDFLTSSIRKSAGGSHEIVLSYRTNIYKESKKKGNNEFVKQKYHLF